MKKELRRSYYQTEVPFKKAARVLIKNGEVVDFKQKKTLPLDILIVNGKIKQQGKIDENNFQGDVIDARGMLIVPGLLDMHVHFREPGREDEETLLTGAAAAMAGGFTAVCTMPNTEPATDNREIVEFIKDAFQNHLLDVYPIAAITRGRQGTQLVEMADLVSAGVVAFSDDGSAVANSLILRRALEYARMFDVVIIEHCEDKLLAEEGVMNEGFISTRLGLKGIPSIAEEVIVARDVMLAKYTDAKIHIAHISTAGSVEIVRRAKAEGVKVTCEATPHHFTLTDDELVSYDTNLKMNPPLRTAADVEAIINGLKDGTIDVIATDHAPHSVEEKEVEFNAAPFGIIGLETAVGLTFTQLVYKNNFSVIEALEKLAYNPYHVLAMPIPAIKEGAMANLTIIDPEKEWQVDKNRFKSRSRNTPFHGWKLKGKPYAVLNDNFLTINTD